MKLSERELRHLIESAAKYLVRLSEFGAPVSDMRLWADRIATYVADLEALTDG